MSLEASAIQQTVAHASGEIVMQHAQATHIHGNRGDIMNYSTATPALSGTAARVRAICEGRDDRLLVLLRIAPPWTLSLAVGKWLRALRAEYEGELELLAFLDGSWSLEPPRDKPCAASTGALLHRLARLRMPAAVVVVSGQLTCGNWCSPLDVPVRGWTLLETPLAQFPRAAVNQASGILAPWPLPFAAGHATRSLAARWSRRFIADLGGVRPGFAASIKALADALIDREFEAGGLALDGLLAGANNAHASRTTLTSALDRLANAVHTRRIASATRHVPSMWSRL